MAEPEQSRAAEQLCKAKRTASRLEWAARQEQTGAPPSPPTPPSPPPSPLPSSTLTWPTLPLLHTQPSRPRNGRACESCSESRTHVLSPMRSPVLSPIGAPGCDGSFARMQPSALGRGQVLGSRDETDVSWHTFKAGPWQRIQAKHHAKRATRSARSFM